MELLLDAERERGTRLERGKRALMERDDEHGDLADWLLRLRATTGHPTV
jgi:hypothetical protein